MGCPNVPEVMQAWLETSAASDLLHIYDDDALEMASLPWDNVMVSKVVPRGNGSH